MGRRRGEGWRREERRREERRREGRRGEDRGGEEKRREDRNEETQRGWKMLTLETEGGSTSQGMLAALRSWKRQERDSPP